MNLSRLLGEDFFISYSRTDAAAYAAALANQLTAKGFFCFFDQWGTEPGREIPAPVLRGLGRSRMLVLVGSPGAAGSGAVESEVRAFLRTRRPIVPISVDGALERSAWFPVIAGASLSVEDSSALAEGVPSAHVLSRLENSFLFTRRNQRVRRGFAVAAFGLLVLIGVAAWTTSRATTASRAATEAESRARAAQDQAERSAAYATRQENIAKQAMSQAELAQQRAASSTLEAKRQQDIAEDRLRAARSLELAAASSTALAAEPDLAALLAVESIKTASTFEGRRALLAAATTQPKIEAFLIGPERGRQAGSESDDAGRITAVWFSANGDRVAAREWSGQISVWPVAAGARAGKVLDTTAGLRMTTISAEFDRVAGLDATRRRVRVRSVSGTEPETILDHPHGNIAKFALSPDGRVVATGSDDGIVVLWSARTGSPLGVPLSTSNRTGGAVEVTYPVFWLEFSADGTTVNWADGRPPRGAVGAADVASGQPATPLPLEMFTGRIATNAGRQELAILHESGALSWGRLREGKVQYPVRLIGVPRDDSDRISALTMSAAGNLTAAGRRDGTIWLFDKHSAWWPSATLKSHSRAVTALAFSPDGERLVSGSDDRTLILWRTREALLHGVVGGLPTLSSSGLIRGGETRFTRDGKRLLVTGQVSIPVVDPATRGMDGAPIVCPAQGVWITSVAASPDGRTIAIGVDPEAIYFADLTTRRCEPTPLRTGVLTGLSPVTALAFSPDGQRLASGRWDGSLAVWNVRRRQLGIHLNPPAHRPRIDSLAWDRDGSTLVVGSQHPRRMWPFAGGKSRPLALAAGPERLRQIALSGDTRLLAGSAREGVYVWDLASGRTVARFAIERLAGQHDGDTVSALALRADGSLLAVGQKGGRLSLFDVIARQWLGDLPGPRGTVLSLDFSSDGERLAALVDWHLVLWPLTPEAWKRRACDMANRNLTDPEWQRYIGPKRPHRDTCPR